MENINEDSVALHKAYLKIKYPSLADDLDTVPHHLFTSATYSLGDIGLYISFLEMADSPIFILGGGCSWEKTEQGQEYWSKRISEL